MDNDSILHVYNNLLAFGSLDESSPISCMFKILLISEIWILLAIQICVAFRTIVFDGKYSTAVAVYVLLDWAKGVALSFTVFAMPIAYYFFFRAFKNAFTAYFEELHTTDEITVDN